MTEQELEKFSVVHFPADRSVEVVPSCWLSSDRKTCPFPKNPPPGFKKLQEESDAVPDPIWLCWEVELLGSYEKFGKANKRAKKALKNLDASSSEQGLPMPRVVSSPIPTNPPEGEEEISASNPAPLQNVMILPDPRVETLIEEFNSFKIKLFEVLVELKEELKAQKTLIIALGNRIRTGEGAAPVGPTILWPLKSENELRLANESLVNDELFKSQVALLGSIGGESVTSTVNNICKVTIAHQFALQLRLTSTSGKLEFGGSLCCKLLRDAVKKFYGILDNIQRKQDIDDSVKKQTTDKKLNSFIGKWLRDSINRGEDGRESRLRHAANKSNEKAQSQGAGEGTSEGNTISTTNGAPGSSPAVEPPDFVLSFATARSSDSD